MYTRTQSHTRTGACTLLFCIAHRIRFLPLLHIRKVDHVGSATELQLHVRLLSGESRLNFRVVCGLVLPELTLSEMLASLPQPLSRHLWGTLLGLAFARPCAAAWRG